MSLIYRKKVNKFLFHCALVLRRAQMLGSNDKSGANFHFLGESQEK